MADPFHPSAIRKRLHTSLDLKGSLLSSSCVYQFGCQFLVSVRFEIRCAFVQLVLFSGAYSVDFVETCLSVQFGADLQFGLRVSCSGGSFSPRRKSIANALRMASRTSNRKGAPSQQRRRHKKGWSDGPLFMLFHFHPLSFLSKLQPVKNDRSSPPENGKSCFCLWMG